MFKRIGLPISFLLYCLSSLSQNTVTDTSATCVAYWQKGDVKNLQITKMSRTLEAGIQKGFNRSSYNATITILDATDTSYTIEWVNKPDAKLKDDSRTAQLYNLVLNLKIIYTTDETGAFDSLVNYEEIRLFVDKTIALLVEQAANKKEFEKAALQMKSIFNNKENVTPLILREVILYHSPFGVEYFSNKIQEGETELANIFGGDPFPATLRLELLKQDLAGDIAKISIRQQIDKEKAADIMNDIFKGIADTSEKPITEKDMIKDLVIDDNSEFDLQLSTGWIQRVHFKREAIIGNTQKTETCEIIIK